MIDDLYLNNKTQTPIRVHVMLEPTAYMPEKAHRTDAGFDLKSRDSVIIPAHGDYTFDTGVHLEIPEGYVGFLKAKSGLNVKHGLTGTGVIDSGYTGSIIVKIYNNSSFNYKVGLGDKIIQLVILPIPNIELEQVMFLTETERGNNGFGSTGI